MKKIFMDLEMNPIDKSFAEERKTCTMETIEIGAICLNEQNEETGNFCEYVKPQYSAGISSRYQKLTGITTEMVQDASPFADVLARFADWCGEGDYTIWSWSDSDIWQILKETTLKHIEDTPKMKYMLNHWRDFQQEFGSMMHITKAMKLERAVSLAGLDFSTGSRMRETPPAFTRRPRTKRSSKSSRTSWRMPSHPTALRWGMCSTSGI